MDWPLAVGVTLFLCVVFALLGIWHRSIQRSQDLQLAQQIHDAQAQGTHQGLTQHPQIDRNRCLGCGSCVRACPEQGVLALVEGKSGLVNASHCVGHGYCEQACPVGALTVGLGDVTLRSDIPVLSEDRETSIPGVFIVGELGGIGLIRHAVSQGTQVIETIAARLRSVKTESEIPDMLDVLIVGCGPSGLAAVLRAHESRLNYAIIDQDDIGGTVRKYPRNKLTLTQPVNLPVYGRMNRTQYTKEELIALWEDTLQQAGIEVRSGVKLTGLKQRGDGTLAVTTTAGTFDCRSLVLAMGRRGTPRRLGVPGEDSERVLYQLTDAAGYSHQDLLVVGGGDSAIEATLALAAQPGNRITLSYRRPAFFRIKPRNQARIESLQQEDNVTIIFNSQVKKIEPQQVLLTIKAPDSEEIREETVPAQYVFVLVGGEPPYALLGQMGVRFGGTSDSDQPAPGQES